MKGRLGLFTAAAAHIDAGRAEQPHAADAHGTDCKIEGGEEQVPETSALVDDSACGLTDDRDDEEDEHDNRCNRDADRGA